MKNGILIKGTILLLATGSACATDGMRYDQSDKYRANEVSLDVFRFTPNIGAFLDARYVFTDGTKNYGLGRAGLRFAF